MLFVLAYQACSSNLRWTGGVGAQEFVYVCAGLNSSGGPQLRDVLKEH